MNGERKVTYNSLSNNEEREDHFLSMLHKAHETNSAKLSSVENQSQNRAADDDFDFALA